MRCFAVLVALAAWVACAPSGRSAPACAAMLRAGDLVITEVFADSAGGADEGKEWFELYNHTGGPVELEGLELVSSRTDGTAAQTHSMRELVIAPGQYLTLGNAAPDNAPPYVDYGYGDDLGSLYNSGGGELALRCGATEVDAVTYTDVKSGHSRELTDAQVPDATLDDDPANWCEGDETPFAPDNYGTPGQDNDCQPLVVGACDDAGAMRPAVPPAIGDLVITEVMPKPTAVSTAVGEWFEIEAMTDVDLNGVGLDRANDSLAPEVLASPDCIHMAAGGYAVFARSDDATVNGGLSALATFSFSLNPTGDADVQVVYGDEVIDQVTWTSSTAGASLQLDPGSTDAASNDDPANFCNGTQAYDTVGADRDLGTPGAINTACALIPGPGQCRDGGAVRAIVEPTAGQLVISELLPNAAGTGTDPAQEWFELANTGTTSFDLNELGFQGSTQTISVLHAADCKPVAPGGYALFAHSTDPTVDGMLPSVDATFTFALSTKLSVYDGTTLLDGVALVPPLPADGRSRQVKPGALTTAGNDDPANFCDAVPGQQYGSAANGGTPKAANVCM